MESPPGEGEERPRQSRPRSKVTKLGEQRGRVSKTSSFQDSSRSSSCSSSSRSRSGPRSRFRSKNGRSRSDSRSSSREDEGRRRSSKVQKEEKPWFKKKTLWATVASIASVVSLVPSAVAAQASVHSAEASAASARHSRRSARAVEAGVKASERSARAGEKSAEAAHRSANAGEWSALAGHRSATVAERADRKAREDLQRKKDGGSENWSTTRDTGRRRIEGGGSRENEFKAIEYKGLPLCSKIGEYARELVRKTIQF